MQIRDMHREEVTSLLDRIPLGRIACTRDNQPHITPLSFAHERDNLFAFSTEGRKIDWMRKNPLVCVEFEDFQKEGSWQVVLVEGRYEELTDISDPLYARAFTLLRKRPRWWEPGYVHSRIEGVERRLEPVFFRVVITHARGRCAVID